MDLLLNELSFHGQFSGIPAFRAAVDRIMTLRQLARRFGRELYCHRNIVNAQVTSSQTLPEVVQALGRDEGRAMMQWFARQGPYWEDARLHSEDDYLEHSGSLVTDTALGEAAFGCIHGQERRLASLVPSRFELSPLAVTWTTTEGAETRIDVHNHWSAPSLEAALTTAAPQIESWIQLADTCHRQFSSLVFADDCFHSLRGHPFVASAARQVVILLDVLHRISGCFDERGERTPEGHRLYQDHFTGQKAWFSDSSDTEKIEFENALTFKDPRTDGLHMFCPWHGKVKTPQIRIHFSWPIRATVPVVIAYVGPKLTKR